MHEIALVFAVLLVDQDHHAPGTHVGDDIEYWADGHGESYQIWRRKARILRCAGAQHALDVTRDQVDFEVDPGTGMQVFQRGNFDSVRNQVDREAAGL
jgi:hypothetical protein